MTDPLETQLREFVDAYNAFPEHDWVPMAFVPALAQLIREREAALLADHRRIEVEQFVYWSDTVTDLRAQLAERDREIERHHRDFEKWENDALRERQRADALHLLNCERDKEIARLKREAADRDGDIGFPR
jgi:uncharacterized protein YecA (UPF0149 family)